MNSRNTESESGLSQTQKEEEAVMREGGTLKENSFWELHYNNCIGYARLCGVCVF